jgi:hypothetical protein
MYIGGQTFLSFYLLSQNRYRYNTVFSRTSLSVNYLFVFWVAVIPRHSTVTIVTWTTNPDCFHYWVLSAYSYHPVLSAGLSPNLPAGSTLALPLPHGVHYHGWGSTGTGSVENIIGWYYHSSFGVD